MKKTIIICVFLLTACDKGSNDVIEEISIVESQVDSCDTRLVFGTCVEYTLSELDDWYLDYIVDACKKNRRDQYVGEYKKNTRCPAESRIAKCEHMIEDPKEKYVYDKHYYVNTAENYSWDQPSNIKVTCDKLMGRFVLE